MRRPLTTLTLVTVCGLLALAAVTAVGLALVRGAGARAHRADAGATRSLRLALSAAPDDLTLAEVSFHASGSHPLSKRSLQVAVLGPFGDDYLAAAAPRSQPAGVRRALVLLVNRPSPLLDPVTVHLRVTAQRSLGAATDRELANPFARAASAPKPALCDLDTSGSPLSGAQLSALASHGTALAGFGPAGAVAEAYDAVCALPYASAFGQAVEQGSQPAPSPGPPVGKLPGEGCVPTPGYACPG